ncbi:MFS transporter [Neorhizobium alkalisoli]|uniref:Nitrate/nitrite transporter NarK n=1 Tax=Neorhizobium alkalisoli TaxID=528178 RepID=A0A561QPC2_9HYPH|nr:MFS transporter [Neorhizobium alkalisoli]TWF52207.1 nitrate/nitrite transporter NarK [Neorhizobium alkalisoli]
MSTDVNDSPSAPTGRWTMLALLCLAVVLSFSTWFSAAAIAPELRRAWALSESTAGWLTNGVQIGFVIGAIAASFLNLPDIIRMNRLMAASAVLAAISNAILLLEPGPVAAVIARGITGFALAGVYPPALKLVSTWFMARRGLALAGVIGAITAGSSLPHLFRGLSSSFAWENVILLSSAASLIAALGFALFTREGPYPFGRAIFNPRQIGQVLKDRDLLLVNAGYFGHMWELYAMWAWLLAYLSAALDKGGPTVSATASTLTFLAVISGVAGCFIGGLLSDRFGRTATTAGMMIVSALCALSIGFVFHGPTWLLACVIILWGISIIGDSAQFSAAVTELADRNYVGTALSLQMGLGFALTILMIWLMPHLAAFLGGWRWSFTILAIGPAFGTWAMLSLRRRPQAQKLAQGRR